jgi:hypothetical protein
MRSQRSPLERAAQGKSIEEGNCGKPADQSDNDYNLSKTKHPAREHSKSGTHCYLRQGTEFQSYKQIDLNPFFNPLISVTMRPVTRDYYMGETDLTASPTRARDSLAPRCLGTITDDSATI